MFSAQNLLKLYLLDVKYCKIGVAFSRLLFSHEALFQIFDWVPEAVIYYSVVKVLLEILQNSQEDTCTRDSFLIKLQDLGLQLY